MTDVVEPETLIENGDSVEELAAGKCKNCGEPTTDGADVCMDCKKKMADNGEELGLNDPTASVEATPDSGTWEGRLALTGVVTGDGRRLEPGGITHRTLPLPLMGMFENSGSGHNGAVIVGNITDIWTEGDSIYGKGNWDAGEDGQRCRQLAKDNMMRGISVDLDAVDDVEFVEGPNPYVNFGKARIMGACYDSETEILTETRGWVTFDKLLPKDRVASMNPTTGMFEWALPHYYHLDEWNGDMYSFTSNSIDFAVTPNHRMLVEDVLSGERKFVSAEILANAPSGKYKIPLTSTWNTDTVENVVISFAQIPEGMCQCGCETPVAVGKKCAPGHHQIKNDPIVIRADLFASLLGMYVAEGSIIRRNGRPRGFSIAQVPYSKGYETFKRTLEQIYGNVRHDGHGFVVNDARMARYLDSLGRAKNKHVPTEVKNLDQNGLGSFLNSYLAGDGSFSSNYGIGTPCDFTDRMITSSNTHGGTWKAYTISKRLVGDLQEISQKIGMWATFNTRECKESMIGDRMVTSNNDQFVVAFKNRPGGRSSEYAHSWTVKKYHYEGDVRCVSVPNETLYVRRNGKPAWCGNTVTPFPAFADAEITMVASGEELNEIAIAGTEDGIRFTGYFTPVDGDAGGSVAVNVESFTMSNNTAEFSLQSIPVEPPAAWFDDPQLTRLQPLTIDANGRVFGHVAAWGSCHISYGDKCRDVPRCGTYKKFMNKTILCDDGSIRACGNVFINTEHADRKAGVDVASDHYANTGAAVADVAVYEDRFGLVIAGAVRPSATPEQIRIFRGSDVSPDWRKLRTKSNKTGKWELVGLLSVNTSGFVVDSLLASGDFKFAVVDGPAAYLSRNDDELEFVSLVAAGIVPRMSLEDRLNDALDRIDELTVKVEELSAKEAERQAFLQTMNLALEFEEVASRF